MPLYSFLGIFLILLSLFQGCSREEKEEHAGSDDSLPPETFRIVSFEPEDANPQDYAWYDSNNKVPYRTGPIRVKSKLPNAFGLYNVHGNLREWVQDFSSDDYSADAN